MTVKTDLYTIRDYIRYATSCFNEAGLYYGHGTDNAWDEAYALILHALHLPYHIDSSALQSNLTQSERIKLIGLISERVNKRIPVPYLTHEAWFAGLSFYVDERVLIPRSPIAELIEKQFSPWIDFQRVHHILDLCTGSACIAIACAKTFHEVNVDASDISQEALAVAKINILRYALEEEVILYQADLFNGLPKKKYDIIVANPPYVSNEEIKNLPLEYRHEPILGLAAGDKGIDFVIQILQQAASYLQPHGILIVEVGNSEHALMEHCPSIPFTWLDFEKGGGGVFLLSADQLKHCQTVSSEQMRI
jgi:ribosomal protein L3 glutamine methyltransferase